MGNIAAAIAAVFNWLTGRNATRNAAPIVQAKTAQGEADADAKTAQAIKNHDTNEIKNEQAE